MTTLTVSPLDWMEASYFYYRPSDLIWGTKRGQYLDKGFNVKFSLKPKNKYLPVLAVGIDDLGGTGYFSKEYISSTYVTDFFKITAGIGWGKFSSLQNKKNPLTFLDGLFEERYPEDNGASESIYTGGTFSYDSWFRGNVGYFGGVEWFIPYAKGTKLKVEYDPFDYNDFTANYRPDAINRLRKKDSNFNYGLSYKINDNLTIDVSYIKGNTFNFSISAGIKTNKPKKKIYGKSKLNISKSKTKNSFYLDLLNNLNSNASYLQTADLNDNSLEIAVMNDRFKNQVRSSIYAAEISKDILKAHNLKPKNITVTTINAGLEMNKIKFRYEDIYQSKDKLFLTKRNTQLLPGENKNFLDDEFRPIVRYPKVFSTYIPKLVTHVGTPNMPILKGVEISAQHEFQFHRQLSIYSDVRLSIANDFDDKISRPGSSLPHVRTDIVRYLQDGDFYIKNFQLDYFWSLKKNLYGKFSAGILESMYGGAGFEITYKPFYENFYVTLDAYKVKKRDFDQRFNFLDYKTSTSHLDFTYHFKPLNIYASISYGRYLAKDDGFTYDFSRRTSSGFRAGFFFTRTDVPFEIFGEGSFDKGFYFEVPLSIFSSKPSLDNASFGLRPLTRDGGAKLELNRTVKSILSNTNYYEIMENWDELLN